MGHKKADDTSGGELGTSERPWGRPRLQLDPDRLHRLREEGRSLREIAREFGVSKSKVWNALRDGVQKVSINSQDAMSPPGKGRTRAKTDLGSEASQGPKTAKVSSGLPTVRYLVHLRTLGRPLRVLHVQFHPEDEPCAKVLREDSWYDAGFKRVRAEGSGEA